MEESAKQIYLNEKGVINILLRRISGVFSMRKLIKIHDAEKTTRETRSNFFR